MRRLLPIALLVFLCVPAPAHAWGSEAHHVIMDRAIGLLPPEIKPLFARFRVVVVERAVVPDAWRVAGFEAEDPNHYLDIDVPEYGRYPFSALPRDWDAAVTKFGVAKLRSNGLVPWRTEEMWGDLRRASEAAIGDRDVYDDAYFDPFYGGAHPIMGQRLDDSMAAVAALIAGACEAAGKPPVRVDPVVTPERRRH